MGRKISGLIYNTRKEIENLFFYYKELKKYKNQKKILYTLTPTHGNLGDHAIVYASLRFLEDNFEDYKLIEITFEDIYKYSRYLKKILREDDIIAMPGGGNMGNHYIWEERARRHIIDEFKNIKIISFPQTIYFSNDSEGKKEFEITKQIYNSNENLILLAREDLSYNTMKNNFKNCNVIKCPDSVFYLNKKLIKKGNIKRSNIMTCLRQDKETYVSNNKKEELIYRLKQNYENVVVSDTVLTERVDKYKRENRLIEIWDKFFESKVVITDRLHGMIFCAITQTPCIVTRSLDHKVVESHKWIKDLNYIKMVDDLNFENIQSIIDELIDIKELDEFNLEKDYFDKLKYNISY